MGALLGCLHHVQTHHHLIGPLGKKKRRPMGHLQSPRSVGLRLPDLTIYVYTSCHPPERSACRSKQRV